jgi:hypothetical protein
MNTRRFISFFAIVAICLSLNACKKEGTDKNASCRIVTVTEVNGSVNNVYNLTYNNDGKISTLVSSGSSTLNKVYTYSGNTMIINVTNAGAFYSRDSITLNDKGRPLNIRQYRNMAGTDWENYALEYNGDLLLKYIQSNETGAGSTTVTVTTTNGNTTKVVQGATTVDFEYFTDKNVQRGDYLELAGLLQYGVNIYPHKNLIKALDIQGGDITNFNYEFGDDGLITKVTGTSGANTSTITYQYQCN